MSEVLFLAAGASIEAGLANAYNMTKQMLAIIDDHTKNFSGDPNDKKEVEKQWEILNFVNNRLIDDAKKRYSDPTIDCVDFELLYNALLQIADYDSPEITPFVKGWDPFIKNNINAERLENLKLRMRLTLETLAMITDERKTDYLKPILNLVNKQNRLVIATTNYDNAIELLARENAVSCNTGIADWIGNGDFDFSADGINLLKLHGSVYWRWSEPMTDYDIRIPDRTIRYIDHYEDHLKYRVAVETPMVIYGQRNKLTTEGLFLDLLRQFDNELNKSNLLTVIGYSFRDEHINHYIKKFLNKNWDNKIRIVMPDFETSKVSFVEQLRFFRTKRPHQIIVKDKFNMTTFTADALKELYP
jgi:hypothetical protein